MPGAGDLAAGAATGGVSTAIQAGAGILQAGIGFAESAIGNARLKKLMQQRTPYSTPSQFYDAFNMATNEAQTGYSAQTMSYLTNQTDRALSSSLDTAIRLGADPNDIANIFDRSVQSIMKNGSDSELIKMQKFGRVYDSVNTLGNEAKAEWADKEAKIKDQMAAAAMKVQAGAQNQQSGLNNVFGAAANYATGQLYKTPPTASASLAPLTPNMVTMSNISPSYSGFNPGITIPPGLQQYMTGAYGYNPGSQTPYGE